MDTVTKEEQGEVQDLNKDILRRTAQLEQMMDGLPRKSGRYLRGIIGNVDCSILDKNEKYQYKESYEQFKLIVNLIGLYDSDIREGGHCHMLTQVGFLPAQTTS